MDFPIQTNQQSLHTFPAPVSTNNQEQNNTSQHIHLAPQDVTGFISIDDLCMIYKFNTTYINQVNLDDYLDNLLNLNCSRFSNMAVSANQSDYIHPKLKRTILSTVPPNTQSLLGTTQDTAIDTKITKLKGKLVIYTTRALKLGQERQRLIECISKEQDVERKKILNLKVILFEKKSMAPPNQSTTSKTS
eukprot:UN02251